MDRPRVRVDFNDMISAYEVLLSKVDAVVDSAGTVIHLREGLPVSVYEVDFDDVGQADNVVADGFAAINTFGGWSAAEKWVLKIEEKGVRHESDETG